MNSSLQTQSDLQHHIRCLLQIQYPSSNKQTIQKDSLVLMNKTKVLLYEYLEEHNIDQIKTQQLYEHISQNITQPSSSNIYEIIKPYLLIKTTSFYEIVIIPIVQYYLKQWNIQVNSKVLQNLVNTNQQTTIQCLCQYDHSLNDQCYHNCCFCYRCGHIFHTKCYNISISADLLYQCPECFLRYFLPDRHVLNVVFKSYLQPVLQHAQNGKITSIIQLDWPLHNYCTQQNSIQLRCFRVGSDYEMTWPQSCNIYLDEQLSVCYAPLPSHSPLKRRHDTPLTISLSSFACSDKIKIQQEYVGINQWHLILAVVVRNRKQEQIFQDYITNKQYSQSEQQSGKYLSNLFWNNSSGISIQQLRISGICQYYRQKIKYPCRSKHCRTHYQPFDLYSFICSSVTAKTSIQRWKCPICGVRAHDIVRDLYLQKLMSEGSKNKDLSFICYEDKIQSKNTIYHNNEQNNNRIGQRS